MPNRFVASEIHKKKKWSENKYEKLLWDPRKDILFPVLVWKSGVPSPRLRHILTDMCKEKTGVMLGFGPIIPRRGNHAAANPARGRIHGDDSWHLRSGATNRRRGSAQPHQSRPPAGPGLTAAATAPYAVAIVHSSNMKIIG
jgi:hypothetical protein